MSVLEIKIIVILGGPVVTTFNAEVTGLIPGWGTKIPHVKQSKRKKTNKK